MSHEQLQQTINDIAIRGKGILAADESTGTIAKRFANINGENSEENRRLYRSLLATTPDLNQFVSGVILFEETLGQKTCDGVQIPSFLNKLGIVPGIKVDKGLVAFQGSEVEKVTQGLDSLADRLPLYCDQGARFAKWRDVFTISGQTPSQAAIDANAELLAHYAKICQKHGVVPIVEPEVLMDGDHDLAKCQEVTNAVLAAVFKALQTEKVVLEHIILKPSMVIPGQDSKQNVSAEQIAEATVKTLKANVPAAVPTINFLSGGQSAEQASENLNAINQVANSPWQLSFSYGRALQQPCLHTWQGKADNVKAAQHALWLRCKLNSAASKGEYNKTMEQAA